MVVCNYRTGAAAYPRCFLKLSVLFLLAASVLAALCWYVQYNLASRLLPLYQVELQYLLPPGHTLEDLLIETKGSEPKMVMEVILARSRPVFRGQVLYAGGKITSQTLLAHVFTGLVIFLSVCVSGGVIFRVTPILLVGLIIPVIFILIIIDVPFVLLGSMIGLEQLGQSELFFSKSGLVLWSEFLTGGGRLTLGLLAGMMVIMLALRLRIVQRRRNSRISVV